MAPKAPLPKGDDGSANRYPVRDDDAPRNEAERRAILGVEGTEIGRRTLARMRTEAIQQVCEEGAALIAERASDPEAFGDDNDNRRRYCGMSTAGYGGCVQAPGHDSFLCRDAFGYRFVGQRETVR